MASFMSFCPHCNNMLNMEEEWRGIEVACPHCGEKFIIPKDTSAAASPAPANAPLQLFPESCKKSNLIWKIGGAAALFIIVAAGGFIFLANRFQTPEPKGAKREKQSVTVAENKPQRASVKPPVANSGKNSPEVAGKTPENGRKNISSTNTGNSSLRNSGVSRNVSGSPRNDGMSKISNNQKKHNKSVVDRDNDGVPDEKEIRCGMNPDDPFDSSLDPDGDGFPSGIEITNGFAPNNAESHPPFWWRLQLKDIKSVELPVTFMAVSDQGGQQKNKKFWILQFNLPHPYRKGLMSAVFRRLGDVITIENRKYRIDDVERCFEENAVAGVDAGGVRGKNDVSRVFLTEIVRDPGAKPDKITLTIRKVAYSNYKRAVLIDNGDPDGKREEKVLTSGEYIYLKQVDKSQHSGNRNRIIRKRYAAVYKLKSVDAEKNSVIMEEVHQIRKGAESALGAGEVIEIFKNKPFFQPVDLKKVVINGTVDLPNGVKLEMVKVEPGTFTMSCKDGENKRGEIEHTKTLTKPFYIGKYEVTQEQWDAIMWTTVRQQRDKANTSWTLAGEGSRFPIYYVSWHEAMEFCEKMNRYAPPGWKFTLPTETQWEFAARGGNNSRNYKYSGSNNIGDVAWWYDDSDSTTHEIGKKNPNELGLYDMSGNVYEWCLDNSNGKSNNTIAEFSRPYCDSDDSSRVLRGGSWFSNAKICRSASRDSISPGVRNDHIGFRLALVPEDKPDKKTVSKINLSENTINLPNGVKLEMMKIKAGTFMMGSPENELGRRSNETLHKVTLTKDYWLGKFEVTQAQYATVMGNNPSRHKGTNRPVENVTWYDAKEFCNKLNNLYAGKLPAGYKFDLPTEAQWEYACRAGTTTALNNGTNLTSEYGSCSNLNQVGWYDKNYGSGHMEVGQKRANNWGLCDMHGNVEEWCRDWYGSYTGDATDPTGAASGSRRVFRGGRWIDVAGCCRSAYRDYYSPGGRVIGLGFRLALVPVQ